MTVLERPLASGVNLIHKSSFAISDSNMKWSGDFTLSEDGTHIFMGRYFSNGDLSETYERLRVGKYLIPPPNIPTSNAEITALSASVDLGEDMLGPIITIIDENEDEYSYFSYTGEDIPVFSFVILGMQEVNGKLIVNNNYSYGSIGLRPQTTFVFDSTNLNAAATAPDPSTTIEYKYSMLNLGHTLGQMTKVEPEWQSFFGGDIFSVAAQRSVTTNWSKGPSVGAFNSSDLVPDGNNLVTIGSPPLLYWPTLSYDSEGNFKGLYDRAIFTPEVIAAMDAKEGYSFITDGLERNEAFLLENGEYTKNSYWNRTSKTISSFIVPNTRTLAVVSIIRGGTREPYYKDAPTQPYEFETVLTGGVTYCVRDEFGVPVPVLDANGLKKPVQQGFVYKAERWEYDKVSQDYFVGTATSGDSASIVDDVLLSIHLFDTLDLQDVKDGIISPWQVEPYRQQFFKQPLDFSATDGINAIPSSGDYKSSTNELYLCYPAEYAKSSTSFYPLINVFDIVAQGAESATSTARLAHSDVPDGIQSIKIWSETDNSLIFDGVLTFSGGVATTTPLDIVSGTIFYARWLGENPPTTGTGIYGVTQYV